MCYLIHLSTTSDRDLSLLNNRLIQFSPELPGFPEEKFLRFPVKWYLARDGCSCGFRHLGDLSDDLNFEEPVGWFREGRDAIEATKQVAEIIRGLLNEGAQVDCVDFWNDGASATPKLHREMAVNLSQVPNACFRFFENTRMEFTIESTPCGTDRAGISE